MELIRKLQLHCPGIVRNVDDLRVVAVRTLERQAKHSLVRMQLHNYNYNDHYQESRMQTLSSSC